MNINDSYGKETARGEVTFVRLLPGPIERVWEYLTDSEKRGEWFASGPLEPKVGGKLELNFLHANLSDEKTPPAKFAHIEKGISFSVTITRYEPPHVLGYTWDQDDEVIFQLSEEGDKVRLVLTHRQLPNRASKVDVSGGWQAHLGVLVSKLEGTKPKPFWTEVVKAEEYYEKAYPAE